ncbi:MAG: tetratricopeptide repeat protein [Bryobacteraceae bacterium]|jgi:Tetratricopeptide repeat
MQGFKTHEFAGWELPAMLATFSSYEDMLGPCHPLTLRLLTEVGITLWRERRIDEALIVLHRGLRDTARALGRNHDLRLRQLATLRDAFTDLGDYEKAAAAQKELLECHAELFGAEHDATFATRATLARILLRSSAVHY